MNPTVDKDEIRRLAVAVGDSKAETIMMTIAERLKQEGLDEGIDLGRRERDEEWLTKWRPLTRRLLEGRFGPLPEHVAARLAAADMDELERWAERVIESSTLDEVFAS